MFLSMFLIIVAGLQLNLKSLRLLVSQLVGGSVGQSVCQSVGQSVSPTFTFNIRSAFTAITALAQHIITPAQPPATGAAVSTALYYYKNHERVVLLNDNSNYSKLEANWNSF